MVSRTSRLVGALLLTLTFAGVVGAFPAQAQRRAGIPGSTTCKPFVATKWANPYPPHEVGDHYQIFLLGKFFSCKSASAFVHKFIAEKIKNTAKLGMPDGVVSGGPAGFVCTSGIGYTGTAYQGHCMAKKPTISSPSFSWGPYNDS